MAGRVSIPLYIPHSTLCAPCSPIATPLVSGRKKTHLNRLQKCVRVRTIYKHVYARGTSAQAYLHRALKVRRMWPAVVGLHFVTL